MPELPEVEFCARALVRWTKGPFRRVIVHDPRSVRASRTDRPTQGRPDGERALREVVEGPPGRPIRHGKRLLWPFGERALLLHLGMAGKWTRKPTPWVRVQLDDLYFSDPRLLGGIVPTTLAEGLRMLHEGLGPDALDAPLPPLRGRRPVKLALMDQSVVAGLGNLHAAEALWRAGVDPRTPAGDAPPLEAAVKEQLRSALDLLDDDEIAYVEDGANPFPLYDREGAPCPRCGTAIARFPQGGRSTWWCPGCQR